MRFGVENINGEWRVGPVAEDGTLAKVFETIFKDRKAAETNAAIHNEIVRRHRNPKDAVDFLTPCWSFEKRGRE